MKIIEAKGCQWCSRTLACLFEDDLMIEIYVGILDCLSLLQMFLTIMMASGYGMRVPIIFCFGKDQNAISQAESKLVTIPHDSLLVGFLPFHRKVIHTQYRDLSLIDPILPQRETSTSPKNNPIPFFHPPHQLMLIRKFDRVVLDFR